MSESYYMSTHFESSSSDGILLECSQLDCGYSGTRKHIQTTSTSTYIKRYCQIRTYVYQKQENRLHVGISQFSLTKRDQLCGFCLKWFTLISPYFSSSSTQMLSPLPPIIPDSASACLHLLWVCKKTRMKCLHLDCSHATHPPVLLFAGHVHHWTQLPNRLNSSQLKK